MSVDQLLNLPGLALALGGCAHRFDADLLSECDSTNAVLLARAEAGAPSGAVVIAGTQTAGRGRRGRTWISAPGDSLTFSLLWRFAAGTAPAGLSLAVGVALAEALEKVGAGGTAIQLKWPNDLLLGGRKLGGILVELLPGAPHAAVIGIGLNLHLPDALPDDLQTQSAALNHSGDPNELLARILIELLSVLERFAASGFADLRNAWMARHAFADVPIRLLSDFAPQRIGMCRGVDVDGALLLEEAGQVKRVLSGEVSLRGVP
ncbi:MAG: biotin--[acetyl-CoA-carboxylase] ligase [Gammaproteobacteria bacterium]|nr:biotin--[acetyl-CoA-carboxylase] ligase [Rhodocyclaceae bacterium]MBU3909331.1 biotin--[acetyl-CoA-carboxylase] ligase [Gammaproteobacteria bacterium]MBU3988721.1 biotin--[acetyl-CoA-carboxylase] ligase [Gammaproteobacteria bacterium]MBU4005509.1 biotin--[acetyl-CoA-carboxylase] ligase [Gammaproteobacteria bacterium]MBU4020938.1 biotin--[acetyl-CoA-carboxylase] ligase [Gammaproteobacteria bacterium]